MNVFEDLLVELKDENLLEETVDLSPISDWAGGASLKASKPSLKGNGKNQKNGSNTRKQKAADGDPHLKQSQSNTAILSDQMSALQFVDFVISAAHRLGGAAGLPFDDLLVQKAFHRYTQAGNDTESEEFLEAELALHNSLRSWDTDLVNRDSNLPVGALRRYTESAIPPLSPQALFALVRFYRTIPFSESALFKFDFVVTRLFSKFVDGDRRDLLCTRSDVVKHLSQRYSKWGLDAFKSLPSDDPDIALVCLSFDEFAAEAESAATLSGLVDAKLFERLHELKRNSGEILFVPQVTAAAIESNLRISKKLFDLAESNQSGSEGLDAELVSDAIARTFVSKGAEDTTNRISISVDNNATSAASSRRAKTSWQGKAYRARRTGRWNVFGINPWLLTATILSVLISLGIYVWSQYFIDEPAASSMSAKVVNIDNLELQQYVATAKLTGDMLHVIVSPQYNELAHDKRQEVVQKVRILGETKGYRRVTFYNAEGKAIAYASADRTDIQ
jgi:hypothetical protein